MGVTRVCLDLTPVFLLLEVGTCKSGPDLMSVVPEESIGIANGTNHREAREYRARTLLDNEYHIYSTRKVQQGMNG